MQLFLLIISLPVISLQHCSSTSCRADATCCSEAQCSNNDSDQEFPRYQGCGCMIPETDLCVTPGSLVTLQCDPGGTCLDHCTWDTPLGPCTWSDRGLQCPAGVSVVNNVPGACSLQIQSVQTNHGGVWRCMATPAVHSFIDRINMTVSATCGSGLPEGWYKSGWRAGLLWTGVSVLIIIIIVAIAFIIFCLCPGCCLCLPCCARRVKDTQDQSHHYSQVRRKGSGNNIPRATYNNRHHNTPVVIENDRRQFSGAGAGYDDQIFERRVDTDRHQHHHHPYNQNQVNNIQVDYEVPRIYSSSSANLKSARKKSNFSNVDLEERIRKASGVGRQQHV